MPTDTNTASNQSNKSNLVNMFANFLMVLISDHSLKLRQGLGTSRDITARYLRDDVIESSCWVGPAKHPHVRRCWIPDEENKHEHVSACKPFKIFATVAKVRQEPNSFNYSGQTESSVQPRSIFIIYHVTIVHACAVRI